MSPKKMRWHCHQSGLWNLHKLGTRMQREGFCVYESWGGNWVAVAHGQDAAKRCSTLRDAQREVEGMLGWPNGFRVSR